MPKLRYFLSALLLATLGTATYAGYRAQARRTAVLERIAALDACLATRNQQRAQAATQTVNSIAVQVHKNHNLPADLAVLMEARQIRGRAEGLADTLRRLRQQWQRAPGSRSIGRLPAQLGSYWEFTKRYVPDALPLFLPHQHFQQGLPAGWLGQFDLAAEPLPAALATLTKLETQVRQYEVDALAAQSMKIGTCCCMFNKISAFTFATSQTVAPGAVYEARLFLTPGASGFKQRMSADGRPVLVDPKTGHGAVRFRIPAARPGQPDTVRAQWRGAIVVNNYGRDTVFVVRVPYFIVKRSTL